MDDIDAPRSGTTRSRFEARMQQIETLWDAVPELAAPALSEEWHSEIKQRSAEFDAGSVTVTSWGEIRLAALARIGI